NRRPVRATMQCARYTRSNRIRGYMPVHPEENLMKLFLHTLLAAITASLSLAVFAAAPYPTKPIRIIVAYTPAGTTDILARLVGQKLSEHWEQPVIVDNRAGAAGNIGTEVAAKA